MSAASVSSNGPSNQSVSRPQTSSSVSSNSAQSRVCQAPTSSNANSTASRPVDNARISSEARQPEASNANPEHLSALASAFGGAAPQANANAATAAPAEAAQAIGDLGKTNLKVGSRGDNVKALQEALNQKMGGNLKVDGIFGPDTQRAVRDFQKNSHQQVDGVVGKNTRGALTGVEEKGETQKASAQEQTRPSKPVNGTGDTNWTDNLPKGLRGQADAYVAAGKKYGVDPRFLAAISMQETGNGTSSAFRNKNNAMGISGKHGPRSFNSPEASIDSMARTLAKSDGYYAGKTKISQIANTYAPIGAANDPNGLNRHWHTNVTRNFRALGGDPTQDVINR